MWLVPVDGNPRAIHIVTANKEEAREIAIERQRTDLLGGGTSSSKTVQLPFDAMPDSA